MIWLSSSTKQHPPATRTIVTRVPTLEESGEESEMMLLSLSVAAVAILPPPPPLQRPFSLAVGSHGVITGSASRDFTLTFRAIHRERHGFYWLRTLPCLCTQR